MRELVGRRPYPVLLLFSIAFGIEEAIIVLYLRLIAQHGRPEGAGTLGLGVVADSYHLEIGRELCTVAILCAIAWLAGARFEDRLRYFLIAFGAWDIVYYIALWLLSGYPSITSNDVLFLIPIPWVGPVWAAIAFAAMLMIVGFVGVASRRASALALGLLLGWLSFVFEPFKILYLHHSTALTLDSSRYPIWLFVPACASVLLALPLRRRRITPSPRSRSSTVDPACRGR